MMRWLLSGNWIDRGRRKLLLDCLLTAPWLTRDQPRKRIQAGLFSLSRTNKSLTADWQPQAYSRIKRHRGYFLVKEDDNVVVKAVSHQSASGLV